MPRKQDTEQTFQSTRRGRRGRLKPGAFSREDLERFEAMRTVFDAVPDDDRPPVGDRWSTWWDCEPLQRGPEPWPDWIITDHGAVDYELGALKSGKEADVFLIERTVPATDSSAVPDRNIEAVPDRNIEAVSDRNIEAVSDRARSVILVAKRYRSADHTQFNRAGDYTAGRGAKRSRDVRAMAKRTTFGLEQAAGRWAAAEFDALKRFHAAGIPVPYPVQIHGTEVLMEFIGRGRTAAPRLAEIRPGQADVDDLWEQAGVALRRMTELGSAHGDLSAYNTVVHDGRLVVLDLPQVVDIYANPLGMEFLTRDVENLGTWFVKRGIDRASVDSLAAEVLTLASMR